MEAFKDRLKIAADYAEIPYSQTAISRSLNVTKQTVDNWMKGSEPRNAMLFHIADSWSVNARWLATGQGDISAPPPGQGLSAAESELIRRYRTPKDPFSAALRKLATALGKAVIVASVGAAGMAFHNNGIAGEKDANFFAKSLKGYTLRLRWFLDNILRCRANFRTA